METGVAKFEFSDVAKLVKPLSLPTRRVMPGGVPDFAHTSPSITIVHGRVVPPWGRHGIFLRGDEGIVAVTPFSWPQYPKVRAALETAGFSIHDTHSWFSRGPYIANKMTRDIWGANQAGSAPPA